MQNLRERRPISSFKQNRQRKVKRPPKKLFPPRNRKKKGAEGIKRLPKHKSVPKKALRQPCLGNSSKKLNHSYWPPKDGLSLPIADLSDYERELGIYKDQSTPIHEERSEVNRLNFKFTGR